MPFLFLLKMKKILSLFFTAFICISAQAQQAADTTYVPENTTIKLTYNNDYVFIKLYNNKHAKAFLDMLPLTIEMEPELNNTMLSGPIEYEALNDSTKTITTSKGELFFYPDLKQIRYVYDVFVTSLSTFPIGKQVGLKNMFGNTYSSVEVTFSKK